MRVFWSILFVIVGGYATHAQSAEQLSYRSLQILLEQGNITQAYEQAQRALLAARQSSGLASPEYAEGLRWLTLVGFATHDYPFALAYAQQEVATYALMADPPPLSYGQALQNQGVLYLHLDSLAAARRSLEQAAVRLEATDSLSYANVLYQLAKVYHRAGDGRTADSLYRSVTDYAPPTPGQSSLRNRAAYYRSQLRSSVGQADSVYRQSISQLRESGDTLTAAYADAYYRWANAEVVADRWQSAEGLYRKAKNIYQAISLGDSSQYASVLNNLGVLALANDAPREAARWIEEAYRIRQRSDTKEEGALWSSVDNLAMAYYENDNALDAIALYEQHLDPVDTLRQYPWQYAVALSNLASIYQDQEQYQRANYYYGQATRHLKKAELSTAEQRLHRAAIFHNVARNYQNLARFDSAIYYFKQAIETIRSIKGTRSNAYVAAISGIAALYHDIGHFVEANIFYQEALKLQEALTGQDNTYANILNNYALACQEQGDFRQANELLDQSLKIKAAQLGTDHPEYLLALTNVGIAHLEAAHYEQARPLLEMALASSVERWGEEHPSVIHSYVNLARLEAAQGNYPVAEPLLQKAVTIAEMYYGREHPEFAKTQIEMANLYLTLGNYLAAKPRLVRSRETLRDSYGPYHPEHATVTQNLAALYEALGNTDTAEVLYREALAIDGKTLGKQHPSYAVTLNNLAALYQNRGDYRSALPLLEESLTISKMMFGEEHPTHTTTLLNLGLLYQDVGNYPQARQHIEQAVAIRKKTLGTKHPDYAYALYSQAVLYHKLGKSDQAEPIFREAIRWYNYQIREYFPALSEKEKGAFYRRIEPVLHAFRDFIIDRVVNNEQTNRETKQQLLGDFYNLQLVTKAILLNASSKIRTAIFASDDPGLIEQYQQWVSSKETLARLYALPKVAWEKQRGRAEYLEKRTNELEKALSLRSAPFAKDIESKKLTWRDVQQTLRAGEAAVEMVRVEKEDSLVFYIALGVTPEATAPAVVVLPEGQAMENKNFAYYQNAIDFSMTDELSYNLYWQPIKSLLPLGTETIYIAPDGVYNKLSLNSLQNPRSDRYLIEESNLRMLSSTRDLVQPSLVTNERVAYLLGYPDYQLSLRPKGEKSTTVYTEDTLSVTKLTANLGELSASSFPRVLRTLPGTEREVDYLEQLLRQYHWRTHKYLRDEAQEEVLKQLDSPRLLHVATHGYFMGDLSEEKRSTSYGIHLQNIAVNPLLRSGLLLAGAEQTIRQQQRRQPTDWQREDGILTAYEALNLNLSGTEMVVLSACETGLGEIKNGEGVYGLQRSFLIAGAQSVLMSLWNVNDRFTAELMQLFYQKWLSGEDKFSALRAAQLEIMKKYKNPYYWGAFVIVGQ